MIKKKICMLGAFAVGKTSLTKRFVESIFSEKYHTTLGVKVDKKVVTVKGEDMNLLIWDIHGEDEFLEIRSYYLNGSSGYILVADVTRQDTLARALKIKKMADETVGDIPFILALNKVDILLDWDIDEDDVKKLEAEKWKIFRTSAKTGENVETMFYELSRLMLKNL